MTWLWSTNQFLGWLSTHWSLTAGWAGGSTWAHNLFPCKKKTVRENECKDTYSKSPQNSRYFKNIAEFLQHSSRWAPSSYKWSYKPYKWPYNWVTGVITPINGVITLLIASNKFLFWEIVVWSIPILDVPTPRPSTSIYGVLERSYRRCELQNLQNVGYKLAGKEIPSRLRGSLGDSHSV